MSTAIQPTIGAATVADRIRSAIDTRSALRVVGSGLWLDAGGPCVAKETLCVRPLAGIVDFIPADFTLTARAGTTLREIAEATAAERLWLPLDPAGSEDGTIGATVATASSGPLSTGFGLPRDMVLGVEAVTGRAVVIRGGGRVVKNVAGFDLTRLFTGSWGTLGVLTEVSLRLRALPTRDETIAVAIDGSPDGVDIVRRAVRGWPFTPIAAEVLSATLAKTVVSAAIPLAVFRIAGNEEAVRAQRAAILALGNEVEVTGTVWRDLRIAEPNGATVVRLSAAPARIGELWRLAMGVANANAGTVFHATIVRGMIRCIIPPTSADGADLELLTATWATSIFERLPQGAPVNTNGERSSLALERRLLETFNPFGVLNPGVLSSGRSSAAIR